ncbi:zinc metalloproteinase nas-30-like isoform X2 [Clytia hemisphaerica]|uniref:zinc metalloproteinase nas-30-like isoform X2 n=1 Tax=Clytia hemisphaerica TaxID=252671 RepID=UPI0034D5BF3A
MKIVLLATFLCVNFFAKTFSQEQGPYFEGDIILTPDQQDAILEQKSKNSFASVRTGLWLDNGKVQKIIEYGIDSKLARSPMAVRVIREAVEEYEKFTCLRFKEVSGRPKTKYHMYFFIGRGCFSNVGRLEGGNRISLSANGCWTKGIAIHEMGHSLGFFHEQSRVDRDNYVDIKWENMFAFAKPGKITIVAKDPKYQKVIGQRGGLSRIDKIQLNRMYCNDNYTTPKPWTVAPKDCKDKDKETCRRLRNVCKADAVKKICPVTCRVC